MGNTIDCYRAAKGAFYFVTHKLICRGIPLLNLNIRYYMHCVINIFVYWPGFSSFVKNDQFKFYRLILLLLCMVIHSNPGPESNVIHSLDIIHLNTRSIRNKLDYLSIVYSFQITCFSETHLDANIDSSNLNREDFDKPLRKDRTRYGG